MTAPTPDVPTADRSTILLRGPADLVEAIPYLLGFHPADSLVVVELRQARRELGRVIRADLAAVGDGRDFAGQLAGWLVAGGDGTALVVYGRPLVPGPLPAGDLVGCVGAALSATAAPLCDALYVGGGRWRSYFCLEPMCCPPGGRPLAAAGRSTSAVAAAATVAGLVSLPDRQALARSLDPLPSAGGAAMRRALQRAESAFVQAATTGGGAASWRRAIRCRFRDAVASASTERRPDAASAGWLTDEEAAELLVGLVDVRIRDDCWRELDRRRTPEAAALFWQLARRAAPPHDAAPLFLLGWAAWRRGDGVLARIAAERALRSDAGYEAAQLLLVALDHGVDPRVLPTIADPASSRRRRRGSA